MMLNKLMLLVFLGFLAACGSDDEEAAPAPAPIHNDFNQHGVRLENGRWINRQGQVTDQFGNLLNQNNLNNSNGVRYDAANNRWLDQNGNVIPDNDPRIQNNAQYNTQFVNGNLHGGGQFGVQFRPNGSASCLGLHGPGSVSPGRWDIQGGIVYVYDSQNRVVNTFPENQLYSGQWQRPWF